MNKENRKDVLLRAAYDLLKRSDKMAYIEEACSIQAFYDNCNCDGYCLMEDIEHELELDEGTKPLPLEIEL
jgi:hypothetical protein